MGEREKQTAATDNADQQRIHLSQEKNPHEQNVFGARGIRGRRAGISTMSPMFQCLLCKQTIERSTRTYWKHKGHLLCSTCKDNIEAEVGQSRQQKRPNS
jgi:hypothetical protein